MQKSFFKTIVIALLVRLAFGCSKQEQETRNKSSFIPVGKGPDALFLTPDENYLYVANVEDTFISVIDTRKDELVQTIDGTDYPWGITRLGESNLVAVSGWNKGIDVIDFTQHKIVRQKRYEHNLGGITSTKDGKTLFVVATEINKVFKIDAVTLEITDEYDTGNGPDGIGISQDNSKVYVTNTREGTISIIHLADKSGKTIQTGGKLELIHHSHDHSRLFISNFFENNKNSEFTGGKTMISFYKFFLGILVLLIFSFILTNCQGDSGQIVDDNTPPPSNLSVTIGSPANGQRYAQDEVVSFNGSAALSGAVISEENLVWTSDIDGVIGLGSGFSRSGLSGGQHTIILSATGPNGEKASASAKITAQPPASGVTVLISSPAGQRIKPSDLLELKGSATAPGGSPVNDPLAFEWRSNLEADPGPFLGNGLQIGPAGLTPGSHQITLTVKTPDGKTGTAAIDVFVDFENSGMTLDILAPLNGFQLTQGNELTCNGSVSLPDGIDKIVWTSSMDGEIGTTETCIVPYMSLGTHRITMTATASDAKKAISIIVEVVE